jgi:Leucine-rich repeat (LRR) protein
VSVPAELTDALEAARASGSTAPLLVALARAFDVEALAPSVEAYVRDSLGIDAYPGPFRLLGIGQALHSPETCGERFGVFGDAPFPALRIGSDGGGIDFWMVLGTGRVITLHHDATLYEVAARCSRTSRARFVDDLTSRGAELDVAQLVRLQAALAPHSERGRRARSKAWADAAATVLGISLTELARRVEQPALELLHLHERDVDELALERRTKLATSRGKKRGAPIVAPLRAALESPEPVRALDLRGIAGTALPTEIRQLTQLASIDLSFNPKLDLDGAFRTLATLPALRIVRFSECALDRVPESLRAIASLEEIEIDDAGDRDANVLDASEALGVALGLPRLRALRLALRKRPTTPLRDALAALPPLGELRVSLPVLDGALDDVGQRHPALRVLGVSGLLVAIGTPADVAMSTLLDAIDSLPQLETLAFAAGERWRPPPDRLARMRPTHLKLGMRTPEWIGELDTLRSFTNESDEGALPESIGELRRLEVLNVPRCRSLPSSIGRLSALRSLSVGALQAWPTELRALSSLRTITWAPGADATPPPCLDAFPLLERASGGPADVLAAHPHLEAIHLAGEKVIPETIRTHASLREVDLWGYDLEEPPARALEKVCAVPHLERLALAFVPGTAAEVALANARGLRSLALHVDHRSKDTFELARLIPVLATLSLEALAIDSLRASETIPDELAQLTSLRRLELRGLGFRAMPKHLAPLVRLRELHLNATGIRAAERARIQKALPGCWVRVRDR